MDWIERLCGLAPDGGTGLTEFLIIAVPLVLIGYGIVRWHEHRHGE